MKYHEIEIFCGIPQKELFLEEDIPLEDQWFHLTQDVTCIKYIINNILEFYIDIGWYPDTSITPDSYFQIQVKELSFTDGLLFYRKEVKTITEMRKCLSEAAKLVNSFKSMKVEQILSCAIISA